MQFSHHAYLVSESCIYRETFFWNEVSLCRHRCFCFEFHVSRHGQVPTLNTLLKWLSDFSDTGSIHSRFVGLRYSARTFENIERLNAVLQSPAYSARWHAVALQIPNTSLWHILWSDLHFYPCKIQVMQQLADNDKVVRVNFCRQVLEIVENDASVGLFNHVRWGPLFCVGYVNKQNWQYWCFTVNCFVSAMLFIVSLPHYCYKNCQILLAYLVYTQTHIHVLHAWSNWILCMPVV